MYPLFKLLCLEKNTIEVLLGRKSNGSGLESREYGRRDPSRWPRGTLYPQKLAVTSPTNSGRSVGIVRSRTKATEFRSFLQWKNPRMLDSAFGPLHSLYYDKFALRTCFLSDFPWRQRHPFPPKRQQRRHTAWRDPRAAVRVWNQWSSRLCVWCALRHGTLSGFSQNTEGNFLFSNSHILGRFCVRWPICALTICPLQ
jgi:hypothetical protein